MIMLRSFLVTVPATTANIGPGFDCLGAALSRYNRFYFSDLSPDEAEKTSLRLEAVGIGAEQVSGQTDNLLYQSFLRVYRHIGQKPPAIQIKIEMGVPLARGLGSSATAIVGGIVGANAFGGFGLEDEILLRLAIEQEGHPDNVVPAFLGGCQLTIAQDTKNQATKPQETNTQISKNQTLFPWTICPIPWEDEIVPVIAIPNFELSTATARKVLPLQYDRRDAIFNMAHLGLLIRALETGNRDWLRSALNDRIHQPYRQSLIPGFEALETAAIVAGAYGLVISGAGPTLLALTDPQRQTIVSQALQDTWKSLGIESEVVALSLDRSGTQVQQLDF